MTLTSGPEIDTQPTPQLLRAAAHRGAGYLAANLRSSGKFHYQRDAGTGQVVPGQYNLLRHFGSLWALLDLRGDDPAVRTQVEQGLLWAVERYYVRTRRGGAFRKRDWIATGCSGLALLALDRSGADRWALVRTELVDYLLAQQIDDATDPRHHDFHHKISLDVPLIGGVYDDVTVAPEISSFHSNYYTGEILFGLITRLGALRRSGAEAGQAERVERAAVSSMRALLARDYGVEERSHWMMYAIRHFCVVAQRFDDELVAWASRIAGSVLASGQRSVRSAPTACRVEAQVQFLDLLHDGPAELRAHPALTRLQEQVVAQVRADCALLLQLQDARTGGFVGSATDPIMQIDYTQHAISGLRGAAAHVG